jgi:hypothetical protein
MVTVIRHWLKEHRDRHVVSRKCYEIIDQFYNPHYQLKIINKSILDGFVSRQ